MATIRDRYILELDTTGATRALNGFKVAIGGLISVAAFREVLQLTAAFEDLRTSLNTVTGSAANGGDAFKFIKQFATETQFSVQELTQSYIQLRSAGIEPTERLLRTFTDAAAVTTDQLGTLEAATALLSRTTGGGLGLEELERLADRGIPVYRILAEEVGITRQQVSEFGQTAEGARTLVEGLLRGIEKEFGGATAARVDNLSTLMSNLGIAVQNVAVAFGEGVSPAVKEVVRDLTEFLNNNQDIARTLGELSGEVIRSVAEAIKTLASSLDLLTGEGLKNTFADLIVGLGNFIIAFEKLAQSLMTGLSQIANAIAEFQAFSNGTEIFPAGTNIDQTLSNLKAYRTELQGVIDDQGILERLRSNSPIANLFGSAGVIDQSPAQQLQVVEDMIKGIESGNYFVELESTISNTGDAAGSLGQRLVEIGERLRETAVQSEVYPDAILRQLEAQQRAAEASANIVQDVGGTTQETISETATAFNEFFNGIVSTSAESIQQLEFARQAVEGLNEQLKAGIITPQVYKEAMDRLNQILGENTDQTRDAARAQEELNRLREQATGLVESYTTSLQRGTEDARRELEQLNMSPLEKQLDNISNSLSRDLTDQVRELQALQNSTNASEIDQQIQAITSATSEAIAEQQRLATESYNTQRSFAYGWRQAFEEYRNAATDAASQARDIFGQTTRGLEDLIVNFAKTGKFEIGDLAETITETLLRQNIQRSLSGILGSGGGAGDMASQIGQLFGSIPGADPVDIRGLESLLAPTVEAMRRSNLGQAVETIRGQTANDALYVRLVNPEFLQTFGAPSIVNRLSPIQETARGLPTEVTYNINAVDARSFKQLVAEDPGFIHAIAAYGAKALTTRRG